MLEVLDRLHNSYNRRSKCRSKVATPESKPIHQKMARTFEFLVFPDLVLFFPDHDAHYKIYKTLRNLMLGVLGSQSIVEIDSVTVLEFIGTHQVSCFRPGGDALVEALIRKQAARTIREQTLTGWIFMVLGNEFTLNKANITLDRQAVLRELEVSA